MYEIIRELCEGKGISLHALTIELSMSRNTFSKLKKGEIKSLSAKSVRKIADYFGVSVDYLYGKKENTIQVIDPNILLEAIEKISKDKESEISEEQALFNSLPKSQQEYLLGIMRALSESQTDKDE